MSTWFVQPTKDACGNPVGSPCNGTARGPLAFTTSAPTGYIPLVPSTPTVIVYSVEPAVGDPAGGTAVTIRGSGFGAGCGVTFAGVAATSVVAVDQFTITCVTPAHIAGSGNVVVTNVDGTHN